MSSRVKMEVVFATVEHRVSIFRFEVGFGTIREARAYYKVQKSGKVEKSQDFQNLVRKSGKSQ